MKARLIIYIGTDRGTSGHRIQALRRLGHEVDVLDTQKLGVDGRLVSLWIDCTGGLVVERIVRKRVLKQLPKRPYDVAWIDSGALISQSLLTELGKRIPAIVSYNHDDPFGKRDLRRWRVYQRAVPAYDLIAIFRDCNMEQAISHGAGRIARINMSADDVAHAPRILSTQDVARWSSEVSFIGTWMPERGPFMAELIRRGVPLSIRGDRWHRAREWNALKPVWRGAALNDADDYAKAIQCAKISLGLLSSGNRDECTTRSFEIPLLGGFFCGQRTTAHFQEDQEAVFWSSAEECAEKCHYWLKHDARRQEIAEAGRLRCRSERRTHEGVLSELLALAVSGARKETAAAGD